MPGLMDVWPYKDRNINSDLKPLSKMRSRAINERTLNVKYTASKITFLPQLPVVGVLKKVPAIHFSCPL